MPETVAIALIAVLGTLGSGFLSYLAARRNTDVQLRSVEAEMQRLREGHAEEHRRERQAAYYELIAQMDRLRQLSYGLLGPVTNDAYREAHAALAKASTNVSFLGEDVVQDPLEEMIAMLGHFSGLVEEADPSGPLQMRLESAFEEIRDVWNPREARLVAAMKKDIAEARRAKEASIPPELTRQSEAGSSDRE